MVKFLPGPSWANHCCNQTKMNNSVGKVIRYTPLSSDQQIRKENYVTNKYERVCSTLLKLQLGSKFKSLCDVHLNAHYLYAHCAQGRIIVELPSIKRGVYLRSGDWRHLGDVRQFVSRVFGEKFQQSRARGIDL